MNYTTESTYTVGIRVWKNDDRGARFTEKVIIVYGYSEEMVRTKVGERYPKSFIEYIEKSF